MKFKKVVEGRVTLKVPVVEKLSRKNPVFYNPVMEFNRDISVAVARILGPDSFCDGLSGSGARGLRIAKEAGVSTVVLNDVNPVAYDVMGENAKLNKLKVEIANDNLNHLLCERNFDFIDIDPFGPPVRYIDCALRAMKKKSWLGVSATDTSALCGSSPRAGKRKYDAVTVRTDYYNEAGLRTLLGFVARASVRYERGISVLFSHSTRHYFRAFIELERGRSHVRKTQDDIGFIQHCFKCLQRAYRKLDELEVKCGCGGGLSTVGPLWTGEFANEKFCGGLSREILALDFDKSVLEAGLVDLVASEQGILTPYYNFHKVCGSLGRGAPKREVFFEKLESAGFSVSRTHFNLLGVRTDAPLDVILDAVKSL